MAVAARYTGERKIHFGSIITTYRCNAKCNMCNIWRYPTRAADEIDVNVYEKLPHLHVVNITGGEAFLRPDLDDIINVMKTKAQRIVISSNGWFVDRTIRLFERHGNSICIRISIEGLSSANDAIRGMSRGFDHAMRILTTLHQMGIKDIGFGLTIQDMNTQDLKDLYRLAKMMNVEFATAALHNSFYFHKEDNRIDSAAEQVAALQELAEDLLKSKHPKDWFRAYFNYGLINYLQGNKRLLPCRMAHDAFFIEPNGDVLPCNGMDRPMPFGNLRESTWDEIWYSERAERARESVRTCQKQCWMMGSVGAEIKKHPQKPVRWVLKHKFLGAKILIPSRAQSHPNSLFGVDDLGARDTMTLVQIGTPPLRREEAAIK